MEQIEYLSPLNNTDFVEQWYELAHREHFWVQWRFMALQRFLRDQNVRTDSTAYVLDIGSGNGVLREQLEAETKWVVDCADLNEKGLGQIAPGRGKTLYYNIEDRAAQCVGQYDFVFAFDVIEHLTETKTFLQAAADHLKPKGKMILNVPALQSMYSDYDRVVGHHRRYDPKLLNKEISEAGLRLVSTRFWGASLVPVLCIRKAALALTRRDDSIVEKGFEPPTRWINTALLWQARIELKLWNNPPLGSSLLALVERQS